MVAGMLSYMTESVRNCPRKCGRRNRRGTYLGKHDGIHIWICRTDGGHASEKENPACPVGQFSQTADVIAVAITSRTGART